MNKEETKKRMKEVLADIQSGKFTKEWIEECKNGQKSFLATRAKLAEHPVEKVGANLRSMMPWISKKKLILLQEWAVIGIVEPIVTPCLKLKNL